MSPLTTPQQGKPRPLSGGEEPGMSPALRSIAGKGIAVARIESRFYGAAGHCRMTPSHGPGRIYRKVGGGIGCVCDQCGQTWQAAATDDPFRLYLERLVASFEAADLVETDDGEKVMVIESETMTAICSDIRTLIASAHPKAKPPEMAPVR